MRDIAWKLFLTRRMRESPYNTPQELYTMQQQQLLWLVQEQGLPYRSVTLGELLGFVASF
jgi:hypothetical protein